MARILRISLIGQENPGHLTAPPGKGFGGRCSCTSIPDPHRWNVLSVGPFESANPEKPWRFGFYGPICSESGDKAPASASNCPQIVFVD
jgi:hypothetical protein